MKKIMVLIKITSLACAFLLLTALSGKTAPAPGVNSLGYAIQMGAFSELGNAERLTNKLQSKGIDAFYYRKDNGIYAVRFGDFPSKEKARAVANRLVADKIITGFYIAPPKEIVFGKPAKREITNKNDGVPQKKPVVRQEPVVNSENGKSAPDSQTNYRKDRDMGVIAARTAERFVGIPYRWGGDTVIDGMDCSGFVRAVFSLCGVSIPRTSREQYNTGEAVSKSDLQDGDLLFFGASEDKINHVGIYVGSGKFVHAPRRGEDIKITTVDESYFEKRFIGAKRYF